MSYKKANEILPSDLLEVIQQYVEGSYIYIPIRKENHKTWGEDTNTKEFIFHRNKAIYHKYLHGSSTKELAKEYYLAQKTIQKIIREFKKCFL